MGGSGKLPRIAGWTVHHPARVPGRGSRRRPPPLHLPGLAVRAPGYEWYCPRCGGRQTSVRAPGRVRAGLARLCHWTIVGRSLGRRLRQELRCCARCRTCVVVRAARLVADRV